jgi:protein SCO1
MPGWRTTFRAMLAGTLALLGLLAAPAAAWAQAPAPAAGEVGLIENLGGSIPLDLTLVDEDGHRVQLGSLIDKPTLLTLNYFRCAGICTPQLNGVVDILNVVPLEPGKDFQVITVSFDPRDTPEIASQKRVNYLKQLRRQFPPAAWRFLTGEGPATRKLADAVGFKFQAQGDDFAHPGVSMMISPRGVVTHYLTGVSLLSADFQMAVADALRGEARPTLARTPPLFGDRGAMAQFCYRYDPEKGQYVFQFTRVAGAVVILLAAGFATFLFIRGKTLRDSTRSTP